MHVVMISSYMYMCPCRGGLDTIHGQTGLESLYTKYDVIIIFYMYMCSLVEEAWTRYTARQG